MSISEFFRGLFGKNNRFALGDFSAADYSAAQRAIQETAVREIAIHSCIGLIASAVSKCEFKIFKNGTEIKDDEYYMWNVRPNINESAGQFIRKMISQLCYNNECLVVFARPENSSVIQALVADTFSLKHEYALKPNVFSGVSSGTMVFNRDFAADEVLYLRLDNDNARRLTDMFYSTYKGALDMSLKAFSRSRGERGTLVVERLPGDTSYEDTVKKLMEDYFKPYFDGNNVALPLPEGYTYTRTNNSGNREYTEVGDTRKLINDIFDITALAYHIPPALLRGEMADISQLMINFLTFCIEPICNMIADEINAKRFEKSDFLNGHYLKIDTSSIKHVDLLDAATAVDKLISSGVVSINEIREALDKTHVQKPWADEHYITKNYTQVQSPDSPAAEGGE